MNKKAANTIKTYAAIRGFSDPKIIERIKVWYKRLSPFEKQKFKKEVKHNAEAFKKIYAQQVSEEAKQTSVGSTK
jgi:hypothetical protein